MYTIQRYFPCADVHDYRLGAYAMQDWTWLWPHGQRVSPALWDVGEPNSPTNEFCANVVSAKNFLMNNDACKNTRMFICRANVPQC